MEINFKVAQRDPSAFARDDLPIRVLAKFLALGFAFFSLVALRSLAAETIPPKPPKYFNDYAGVVSPGVAQQLNLKLAQFERDTSDQVVVAVYRKMESDSDVADYAQRVAHQWQIGLKGQRNGVLLLVFIDSRKASIQVGYGLEGTLPDVTAFDIRERHMNPRFRAGDYEGGLVEAVDLICKAILGEYKGTGRTHAETDHQNSPIGLLGFLILLVIFLLIVRASRKSGGYRYTGLGGPFISGGWGGSGGWSGGSSGSSGGFGSFSSGGGDFGGGGSSGSW